MNTTQSPGERIKRFFSGNSMLPKLLLVNIAVWLIIYLGRIIAFLFKVPGNDSEILWIQNVQTYLAIPASVPVLLARPWTIITYMFLHIEFWHMLFNMFWLYWFGKIFLEFLSNRQLLTAYLLGGITGGLVFMAAYNIFPVFSSTIGQSIALGASASVLAIVIMISFVVPDYTISLMFIGKLKIKYIAIVMVVMDILMIRSGNAGGHFAHLGGALWGISYALLIRKGLDPARILSLFDTWNKKTGYARPRKVKFKKVHATRKPLSDEEYNTQRAENQQKIDNILDKIAKSGYSTLSKEEKEFLFKSSKKS